jgi:hypothetical protein
MDVPGVLRLIKRLREVAVLRRVSMVPVALVAFESLMMDRGLGRRGFASAR